MDDFEFLFECFARQDTYLSMYLKRKMVHHVCIEMFVIIVVEEGKSRIFYFFIFGIKEYNVCIQDKSTSWPHGRPNVLYFCYHVSFDLTYNFSNLICILKTNHQELFYP